VEKRLREEFDKLQVEVNDEKSRTVDLGRGKSFGFLGLDFRYTRSFLRGVWRPYYTPKLKKRTALVRSLKEVFRRHRSQPIERVISLINPILRGWVSNTMDASFCVEALKEALARYGKPEIFNTGQGQPVYWFRFHQDS
jgi:RNA-directed DNA polymerase